jgi:hypothetical protein
MPDELPIYSQSGLRTGLQFAGLERLKTPGVARLWTKADAAVEVMEGASGIAQARAGIGPLTTGSLLDLHLLLFPDRTGAGRLRAAEMRPLFRGQDSAPPGFIERSLDNMADWFAAESFQQIHPIEQCALAIARIVDIWPFEFGNLTVGVVVGNSFLEKAELAPFFVPSEHAQEFQKALGQAMTIDMQPLINAIYNTVKREMEGLGGQ